MPEYIEAKTILSKLKGSPDPYFGVSYNMNLYRGCQHQCIYCDSRSNVYGIGDLSHIRIKKNAIELLEKALKVKRKKGTVGTGSMNDPYMPVEKQEKLTRSALKLISDHHFPIHIITKSNLVNRDLDIIQQISKIYAAVSLTITTSDDNLSKIIEPGAVVSSERLKAMREMANVGIYTGTLLTPVLPFITDKPENIYKIVQMTSDAGGKYILAWMGMTQREGQREYFHNKLDQYFPGTKEKYINHFGNSYSCSSPRWKMLSEVFMEACGKYNISMKMNFYHDPAPTQLELFK